MYQKIKPTRTAKNASDAVAVPLFDGGEDDVALPPKLDESLKQVLREALARPEVTLGRGESTVLYPTDGPGRVIVLGLGKVDACPADALREAGAAMVRCCDKAKVKSVEVRAGAVLDAGLEPDVVGRAIGEGVGVAAFDSAPFRGEAKKDADGKDSPKTLTVRVGQPIQKAFDRAVTVADSANFARHLALTPPNKANPAHIVTQARKIARDTGLTVTVLDEKELKKQGMGGILAVGQAGSTPPAMIVLEHKPEGAAKQKPIILVGKAVTFDTGGYSLKTRGSMAEMKYDKCGGMAVLGAMRAIASLKLKRRVVGLVPTVENMVDQNAYRPDDVLTMHNGVTVEVTNTDAEGRLILADALSYGHKHYDAAAVVDLATLTGGVVVALGSLMAGCFCNDAALRQRLFDAGEDTGEQLWHLPLWTEHRALMDSKAADIVNSGGSGKGAHAIQGAAFLSFFVDKDSPKKLPTLPWAHLDIAGVADAESDTKLYPKGPTGFGVRLLTRFVEQWRD